MYTKRLISGIVNNNQEIAYKINCLTISAPINDISLKPGNFIHLSCPGDNPTILRRPFSIFRVEDDKLKILYKVKGKGTENLSLLKVGDKLDFIVPCGNNFVIPEEPCNIALIAGGIGIAPICFLLDSLKSSKFSGKVFLYYGVSFEEERIPLSLLNLSEVNYYPQSDYKDGKFDKNLFDYFTENEIDFDYAAICGPKEMLKVFSKYLLEKGRVIQVSIEEVMACGIGACFGCSIRTVNGNKKVCTDGPIFYAKEVDFSSL